MKIYSFSFRIFVACCLMLLPATASPLLTRSNNDSLVVNLGYAKYLGVANQTTNINSWRGIRYAAPPTGSLRYQAPQAPLQDLSGKIINAQSFDNFAQCPQSGNPDPTSDIGDEDCLFLSVFSSANAIDLPVFVWIHGGGFENGNGKLEFTEMMQQSNNSFVVVVVQYRLNSFGFLSSPDVQRHGQLNAGLLDQKFALEWVQKYIHFFGGNRSHVTIGGESAGSGSIYYHTIAMNGALGTSLWNGSILSSAAAIKPYHYTAAQVNRPYYRLASAVGCLSIQTTFECLVNAPFATLQNASNFISQSEIYGIPPYTPVIDGEYITAPPSELYTKGKVNGQFSLTGNQANEGFDFVPNPSIPNYQFPTPITSSQTLATYIAYAFPLLTPSLVQRVLAAYPLSLAPSLNYNDLNKNNIPFTLATAIISEPIFYCPSIWVAQSMARSYRYQFSVPPALHASDLAIYLPDTFLGPGQPGQLVTPAFRGAFLASWINFILRYDPSNAYLGDKVSTNGTWPVYSNLQTPMVNFNVSGGEMQDSYGLGGHNVSQVVGGVNDFTVVDEGGSQGGRGARCDFWRSLGAFVPV